MNDSVIRALLVIGALLELSGLVLVAWDVLTARRQRADLSRPDKLIQPSAARGSTEVSGTVTAEGGGPPPVPTLEDRVASIESGLSALHARLDAEAERHVDEHRELTDRIGGWIAEVRREVFDLEQRLRPVIGSVAAGHIGRRALGVVLFAIGVLVQTVANFAAL